MTDQAIPDQPICPYHYHAKVVNVVDGDTVDAVVDVGFHMHSTLRLRLRGINTPERGQPGYELARNYLATLIEGQDVIIKTNKTGSFGRWLADIYFEGDHVNADLLEQGLAEPYPPK